MAVQFTPTHPATVAREFLRENREEITGEVFWFHYRHLVEVLCILNYWPLLWSNIQWPVNARCIKITPQQVESFLVYYIQFIPDDEYFALLSKMTRQERCVELCQFMAGLNSKLRSAFGLQMDDFPAELTTLLNFPTTVVLDRQDKWLVTYCTGVKRHDTAPRQFTIETVILHVAPFWETDTMKRSNESVELPRSKQPRMSVEEAQ